jgi:hypothetical protein
MRLFHVSEEADIGLFEPRVHPTWPELAPVVWAVGESHLRNYLLPRECPRVTFYALETSRGEDVTRHLGGNRDGSLVAVEGDWLERIAATTLYVYEFAADGFVVVNAGAGYFHAQNRADPIKVHEVSDLVIAIKERGAAFRTLDNLWPLSDQIVASTLQFSMIRMRNAKARPDGKPSIFGRHV